MVDDRPKWHPILACEEYQPGQWVMLDQYRRPYAMIDIIRRGDEVGYRVTTWSRSLPPDRSSATTATSVLRHPTATNDSCQLTVAEIQGMRSPGSRTPTVAA